MIRVTVEIVPHGWEPDKFVVATCELWNMNQMSSDRQYGNYGYRVMGDWEHYNQQESTKVMESGVIEGFPRAKGGAWALLREALTRALPGVTLKEDFDPYGVERVTAGSDRVLQSANK